jgi:signal transduction histidine kinase
MSSQAIRSLLLVEDDPSAARLLLETFRTQGSSETEVTHVERMRDAEEYLAERSFDIILLDPGLPDSQGIESVQRAHEAAPHVPLVVLTGQDDESLAIRALQAGAQDYLIKGQVHTRGLLRFLRYAVERNLMEGQLRAVGEELERSNRELQDFATIVSHDLQEPLRKIQAFGDRLAEHASEVLDDEGKDSLGRMTSAAARMQSLIDDVLEYSQVTARPEPPGPVDLDAVVPEVIADLDERIRVSGGNVSVGPLPTILANPVQMRQLFQNLIANALKFHPDGVNPEVHVDAVARGGGRRSDDRAQRGGVWEIRVRDNGIGFDNRASELIFAPFQRLHGRESYEGTGIGLAISRRIVGLLGGTLTAISQPGAGATFVITLPQSVVVQRPLAPVA